jgi:hypothetical protein
MRVADLPAPPDATPVELPAPRQADLAPPFTAIDSVGYWSATDLQLVEGSWLEPGPGTAWLRLRCPVIDGETPSPLQRVAAAADFGSGVGNPVRASVLGAINPDLTVHVHRAAAGEWIALRSRAWAHSQGVGMADTELFDDEGPIGRAVQSLLVQPLSNPTMQHFARRIRGE